MQEVLRVDRGLIEGGLGYEEDHIALESWINDCMTVALQNST